jgi:hypothetical protein
MMMTPGNSRPLEPAYKPARDRAVRRVAAEKKRRPGSVGPTAVDVLSGLRRYWTTLSAVSSMKKLVCSDASSVPVNLTVTEVPLNAVRSNDFCT